MDFRKICVIGLGYIGLPTASTFATHGIKVVGVDNNPQVVKSLQNGDVHIYEPGLRALVENALKTGNLSISAAPEPADAFIICVPTPFYEDKRADMRAVTSATQSIVPHLRKGSLVMLESTSPPQTTTNLVRPILEQSGLTAGVDFHLAYTPERVLPGQILRELIENTRVIGGIDRASAEAGRDLYAVFARGEIILTTATTAEMVKLMENTYRDINIAIAMEFSRLAERFGVDIWEAISLANRHPRVRILNPGPGVGGHCISVDPWFLVEAAPDLTPLIKTARQVNDSQPHFVLNLVKRALPEGVSLNGLRIAALGLAFKPDVDDLRESPAVEIAHLLQNEGAQVLGFEPFKPGEQLPGLATVPTLQAAVAHADLLLLLVAHTPLKQISADQLASLTPARLVVDTVNGWDAPTLRQAGFTVHRLGVG